MTSRRFLVVSLVLGLLVVLSAFAQEAKVFKGYLVDGKCAKNPDILKDPAKHTVQCLKMPDCVAAGYGIFEKQAAGFVFVPFDKAGTDLAKKEIVDKTKATDNLLVEVTGVLDKNILTVKAIKEVVAEVKPAEAKPASGSKPAEAKPAEAKPAEEKPADKKAPETK